MLNINLYILYTLGFYMYPLLGDYTRNKCNKSQKKHNTNGMLGSILSHMYTYNFIQMVLQKLPGTQV